MNVVIKIEDISKQYRLGSIGIKTMKDDFQRLIARLRGKENPFLKVGEANDRSVRGKSDYVWALNNLNFDVEKGTVLGIIGKNGAGKSTLLKILSRITIPTTGTYKIKGRVASLLEVGTGFHKELSGRDNIFLNGAILGMSKSEIVKKFDEIVEFSGVERYIDTPVKRYSSGMYVRLAFAVAAHLEPEILIIDEVLAVGDAEFQKRCLGKMKDISGQGRTILFVSHNMEAISSLCHKVLLLEKGESRFYGDIESGLLLYRDKQEMVSPKTIFLEQSDIERYGANRCAQLQSIEILNKNVPTTNFYVGDKLSVIIEVNILQTMNAPEFGVAISNYNGQRMYSLISSWNESVNSLVPGKYFIRVDTDELKLYPAEYSICIWVKEQAEQASDDFIEDAVRLNVLMKETEITKQFDRFSKKGGVFINSSWKISSPDIILSNH